MKRKKTVRVLIGDKLREDDRYWSTSGSWQLCPCPGLIVENNSIAFFRVIEVDDDPDQRKRSSQDRNSNS
jgi:hypothetical protein